MRKLILLALLALAVPVNAQSGPKFGKNGGVGSATSTFDTGEPVGGTYAINGTTGTVSTPVINLRPGGAPSSPQNGDCWSTTAGISCRINGVTTGPLASVNSANTWTGAQAFQNANITGGSAVNLSALTVTDKIQGVYFETTNNLFPLVRGSTWASEYHPNWNVVRTTKPFNPTEWQVYSNAANGIAQVLNGTNQVVRVSGSPFDASWVGQNYFYWEGSGYRVASVTDADHLTVQTTGGGTVSWGSTANGTFYYVTTDAAATCNVSGTAVSWVSGDGFIPNWAGVRMTVNGSPVTFTYNSQTSLTLTSGSLGTLTNAACYQTVSIANELSNIRLQGLAGSSEENFVITFTPAGSYIQNAYAGAGKYRPMWIGTGENPAGTFNPMLALRPSAVVGNPGTISLGGDNGNQAMTINQNSNNVNFMLVQGATTGVAPSFAARGANANVGMAFDMQGASTFAFTSGSFTKPELNIFGSGGACYSSLNSTATGNEIGSLGGTSCRLSLIPGSGGVVYAAQPLQLPTYTVSALPACNVARQYAMAAVTDATAPTYNGVLTGGGAVKIPVFCNGTTWTAH